MKDGDKTALFHCAALRPLIAHTLECACHEPCPDQMRDGRYRYDGRDVPMHLATPDTVDERRVPAGLHLVDAIGICLKSNGLPGLDEAVYAEQIFLTQPSHAPAVNSPSRVFMPLESILPLVESYRSIYIRVCDGQIECGGFDHA